MTPMYSHAGIDLYLGDCRAVLATLPDQSVQTCITSPPYFGLRDYGTAQWEGGDAACDHAVRTPATRAKMLVSSGLEGSKATVGHSQEGYRESCPRCGARRIDQQIGLEASPAAYVAEMVSVFREVRRVLRDDGVVWLNLGDSYAGSGKGPTGVNGIGNHETRQGFDSPPFVIPDGLKPKDLIGVPWRIAFALQADGWYLRSDIIYAKPNPMPESVTDRPTRSHEYIFLLSKQARYFYDADAIAEAKAPATITDLRANSNGHRRERGYPGAQTNGGTNLGGNDGTRNKRDVWTVSTQAFPAAHFATFPEALIRPCILAGCPAGGIVLDPFCGAGTTLLVAKNLGRHGIGIELNPDYCQLIVDRLAQDVLALSEVTV